MYNYSNCYDHVKGPDQNTLRFIDQPQTLINSQEGFIRGNMFNELYDPYLPTEPYRLTPQTEREAMLNKVREYTFALIDLNLYLDTHPNDVEKIKVFNQYSTQLRQVTNEFESRFGPLSLSSEYLNSYPWAWISTPWPWEVM